MEPAKSIIDICGGYDAVARMTGRNVANVYRWTYPKEKGGTGGIIPAEIQRPLLDAARAEGKPLTPDHFFRDAEASAHTASRGSDLRGAQEAEAAEVNKKRDL